jgi:hypothetical protein
MHTKWHRAAKFTPSDKKQLLFRGIQIQLLQLSTHFFNSGGWALLILNFTNEFQSTIDYTQPHSSPEICIRRASKLLKIAHDPDTTGSCEPRCCKRNNHVSVETEKCTTGSLEQREIIKE